MTTETEIALLELCRKDLAETERRIASCRAQLDEDQKRSGHIQTLIDVLTGQSVTPIPRRKRGRPRKT